MLFVRIFAVELHHCMRFWVLCTKRFECKIVRKGAFHLPRSIVAGGGRAKHYADFRGFAGGASSAIYYGQLLGVRGARKSPENLRSI